MKPPSRFVSRAIVLATFALAAPSTQVFAAPYKVDARLSQVSNLKQMEKLVGLQPAQKKLLAQNLFVCTPTNSKQLFHILENNDYRNAPSFISTDLMLQLYHIFFDYTLRKTESEKLTPILKTMTSTLLKRSIQDYENERGAWKDAALKNVAYFAVADRALGGNTALPAGAQSLVQEEMQKIEAHGGFDFSAIFPYKIDYSQFIARGHYTRSETLRRYFRAMMWYGLVPFALRTDKKLNTPQIQQGMLMTRALYATGQNANWARIYEPTTFYVAAADDLTPSEWHGAMQRAFGSGATTSEYSDNAKFAAFVRAVEGMRASRIRARFATKMGLKVDVPGADLVKGPLPDDVQLRFMGQRDIPDAEITQKLSVPLVRPWPSGLDVMAALGSRRAATLLDASPQIYNPNNWTKYRATRQQLTREFAALPNAKWSQNLYWGWLDMLRTLNAPVPKNAPSFMQNSAWQDKSLNTALASWSQLKHDTVLYGKQSAVEGGGDGGPIPFVRGYVEPNVAFWNRLALLTRQSRDGLAKRGLLSAELMDKFSSFGTLAARLKTISQKELSGTKLSKDDYEFIRYLGAQVDTLTLGTIGEQGASWHLVNATDRDMAVITDVHTVASQVLQTGVGHAYEMLVIVPIEGKLSLTRGAVFSYYEFAHPSNDRLTDEKWQKMLNSGKTPPRPHWTKSFVAPVPTRNLSNMGLGDN